MATSYDLHEPEEAHPAKYGDAADLFFAEQIPDNGKKALITGITGAYMARATVGLAGREDARLRLASLKQPTRTRMFFKMPLKVLLTVIESDNDDVTSIALYCPIRRCVGHDFYSSLL